MLRGAFAAGFAAGAAGSLLTVLAERSRLQVGSVSLAGNGALGVLLMGGAIALYLSWTWLLRRGAGIKALVAATAGAHFGIGVLVPITAALAGTLSLDSFAGFALQGLLFVVPTAILAGIAAWAFLSGGLPLHPIALAIVTVAMIPLAGAAAPIATGLGTGVATAVGVRAKSGVAVWLTTVLFILFLLLVNFGVPLLYPPR